ncbi:Uncharacterised protein [Legionella steigerwaltii]|uniref:Uncharacterized protein n=1 Tax=Legionella steigerwaltii TaxID=460 RepID=A0A378LBF1_9GAMM|nr:hypothetical protein [Legionella steigerwaltii]KTD81070.1 hypothetical protein Lstg_0297 [Legionella steigerwaltii]STY23242.1 Uncharacterised protein [Legionella steigerwaltii]
MKKRQVASILRTYRDSNIDEIEELKKSYNTLVHLGDEEEVPDEIEEECHHVIEVISNPSEPHYPFYLKEFIPNILEENLDTLLDGFEEGDLVYGISGSRISLFYFLREQGKDVFATRVDELFNATIDPFLDPLLDPSFAKPTNPFYASAQTFKSYASLLNNEIEQLSPLTKQTDKMPFIKKMSKMGVFWTLSNEHKLHFVLNKIDYKLCFDKKFDKITFAELRFLYRYWEQFKPYYERGQINFYFLDENNQLKKVEAPWESNPEIVRTYIPQNIPNRKYHAFFNSFIIDLLKNEIKKGIWKTGFLGLGGGKTISIDGQEKTVPHRVARIYKIATDPTLSSAEKYIKILAAAEKAIRSPKKLQKPETTEFYQAILDFDKKMTPVEKDTLRFFKGRTIVDKQQEIHEKDQPKFI